FLAVRTKITPIKKLGEARVKNACALPSAIRDILPMRLCDALISPCAQKTIWCFCLGSQHCWPSHCLPPAVVVVPYPLFRRQLLPRQRQAALLPHPPAWFKLRLRLALRQALRQPLRLALRLAL